MKRLGLRNAGPAVTLLQGVGLGFKEFKGQQGLLSSVLQGFSKGFRVV